MIVVIARYTSILTHDLLFDCRHGVPIIMKAGKALNEGKAEMRIQFKDAPAGEFIFQGQSCPRNELGKELCFYVVATPSLFSDHFRPFHVNPSSFTSYADATQRSNLHEN